MVHWAVLCVATTAFLFMGGCSDDEPPAEEPVQNSAPQEPAAPADASEQADMQGDDEGSLDDAGGDAAATPPPSATPEPAPADTPAATAIPTPQPPKPSGGGIISSGVKPVPSEEENCRKIEKFKTRKDCFEKLRKAKAGGGKAAAAPAKSKGSPASKKPPAKWQPKQP